MNWLCGRKGIRIKVCEKKNKNCSPLKYPLMEVVWSFCLCWGGRWMRWWPVVKRWGMASYKWSEKFWRFSMLSGMTGGSLGRLLGELNWGRLRGEVSRDGLREYQFWKGRYWGGEWICLRCQCSEFLVGFVTWWSWLRGVVPVLVRLEVWVEARR